MRIPVAKKRREKVGGVPTSGSAAMPEKPPETEKVSEPVKLRPTFKFRLQRVAQKADKDMGILIEEFMADYINREYRLIVQEELAELNQD